MRVKHHIHTNMNIPWYKPRREKSSSQSDCEGGQARRHFWIIQMSEYASLSVANNLRESMLETARRWHLSNSATTLLRASSTAVLILWPPRNGDPVEDPAYVYVLKDKFVFKVCFLIRAFVSEKCSCVLKNKCVCIFVYVRVKKMCVPWLYVLESNKMCVHACCGNLSVQYLPRQLWSPRGQKEHGCVQNETNHIGQAP